MQDEIKKVSGYRNDVHVQNAIQNGNEICNKTPLDHYELGNLYQFNVHDYEQALDNYNAALDAIARDELELDREYAEALEEEGAENIERKANDHIFIIDRIAEVAGNHPGLRPLPQVAIANGGGWHSDSQNVHDSAIIKDIISQYRTIKSDNDKDPEAKATTLESLRKFMQELQVHDEEYYHKMPRVNKALDAMSSNEPSVLLGNLSEREILTTIWQRANATCNVRNRHKLKEAVVDSLHDCVENGSVVCPTGRIGRVMASLALNDANEEIGVLKNKEALRNELYFKTAQIVQSHVGPNAKTEAKIIDDYNNSRDTPEVQKLKHDITLAVIAEGKLYKDRLPNQQIEKIVEDALRDVND